MIDLANVTNSEIAFLIDEYVHNEVYRDMLKDRFINGMCFEPLAEKYNFSVRHTKHIIYKEGDKVFRHLKSLKGDDERL